MTSSAPVTLVEALLRNAAEHGREVAVRERRLGIWQSTTWAEFADDVLALAAGLDELGLGAGQALTILGDNRYRLYVAMLAATALRAFPAPVFADVPPACRVTRLMNAPAPSWRGPAPTCTRPMVWPMPLPC